MATKRGARGRSADNGAAGNDPAPGTREPGSGIASGTVGQGGAPSGYYWDRLKEAEGDSSALDDLLEELETHGYRGGQVYTAAQRAYDAAGAPRRRSSRRGKED